MACFLQKLPKTFNWRNGKGKQAHSGYGISLFVIAGCQGCDGCSPDRPILTWLMEVPHLPPRASASVATLASQIYFCFPA